MAQRSSSPTTPTTESFHAILEHAFEDIAEHNTSLIAPTFGSFENTSNSKLVRENGHRGKPWEPRSISTTPWLGLSALFGGLLCSLASAVVLATSNGKSTTAWPSASRPIQPTVILAILTATGNVLLLFAFQQGVTISWWLKLLQGGDVADTHRYWAYGTSAFESISSGRQFNKVALACLATAIMVIDGPFLQRASTITTLSKQNTVAFSAQLNSEEFPSGFTGYYPTNRGQIFALTQAFAAVSQSYTSRSTIALNSTGCDGTCTGEVIAPGFDVSCTSYPSFFNVTSFNESNPDAGYFEVGHVNVVFDGSSNSGLITVNTLVKPETGVYGEFLNTACELQIARVRYPISISKGGVTLLPARSRNDTVAVQYPGAEDRSANGLFPSRIGGIAQVATNMYQSEIRMVMQPMAAGGLQMQTTGPMSTSYLQSSVDFADAYNLTWRDPSPDVVSTVRELAFRAAIANSDASTWQTVTGSDVFVGTYYASNYGFLGGALAVVLLSICAIMPLFFGWWHLGRRVTLSPVEVAKAFDAPLLRDGGSNAKVDGLLKECGKKRVRYGAVSTGVEDDRPGQRRSEQSFVKGDIHVEEAGGASVLRIAETERVSWPLKGVMYTR